MRSKKILAKVRGYTLIESVIAVNIIAITLFLSMSVLNNRVVSAAWIDIRDMESMADSIMQNKPLVMENSVLMERPWGIVRVEPQRIEAVRGFYYQVFFLSVAGTKLLVTSGFYTLPKHANPQPQTGLNKNYSGCNPEAKPESVFFDSPERVQPKRTIKMKS